MKKQFNGDTTRLEEQSMLIAGEIFNSLNQYTHDSNISKFFLTDDIANACYGLAGGFASVIYIPQPEPEEIKNTTALSFIYALMTYGFNIYLKEHSLSTNAAPYTLPRDPKIIKKIQKKTLSYTSRGKLVSTPLADKIIRILTNNIKNQVKIEEFTLKGYRINKSKFLDYSKLSIYWGYNFARELLNS
ncbi:hypothetical protein KJ980_06820 [Patescibacteria group bacterium]|nr:hypothetical protein [Patescibacteria group bacterium]MBU4099333.1 hypothetical protein [Patescibacteria group bacterium]